ncbi:MAG: cytochrome c-type biogenesis protein CcmH [Bryobacteraceae bacterium]
MFRWKSSIVLVVLVAMNLAYSGTPLQNPEVRRIGELLGCQCGCGSSVTSCNMVSCHSAEPLRAELLEHLEAGRSEPEILKAFSEKYGLKIVLRPPTEGFFLVGWIMPFAAVLIGLALVIFVLRRMRRPADVPAVEISSEEYARYRERIEKDVAKLD